MITFKSFMEEQSDNKIISKWSETKIADSKSALAILESHCGDAIDGLKSGIMLLRGVKSKFDYRIIDTGSSKRASRDTTNIYQLMLDSSENFINYPKRSNSLICTTNLFSTQLYGDNVCAVFPYDGLKFAVSDIHDFLSTRIPNIFGSDKGLGIWGIDTLINGTFQRLNIRGLGMGGFFLDAKSLDEKLSKISGERFITALNATFMKNNYAKSLFPIDEISDEEVKTLYKESIDEYRLFSSSKFNKVIDYFIDNGFRSDVIDNLCTYLNKNGNSKFTALSSYLFSPEKLRMKLADFDQLKSSSVFSGYEIWFSGKSLQINLKSLKPILRMLSSSSFKIHPIINDIVNHKFTD